MAGTIADKVQAILDAKADIADAIEEKHGVVPQKFSEYGDAIRNIPQNEAPNISNPVKFVDYDGTLLYSYGVQAVRDMTELPELPERTGLTNQGWNYTLEQLQQQVQTIGKAIVGCNYITSDGKTRFYITIRDPKFSEFRIGLGQTATQGFTIDWGDGSSVDGPFGQTTYAVRTHAYSPSSYPASYVITLTPQGTGKPLFVGAIVTSATQTGTPTQNSATTQTTALGSMFDKIEVGDVGSSLGSHTFRWMTAIKTVNIPKCITSIGQQSLGGLDAAKGLVIPSSVTSIAESTFAYDYATEMISLPTTITSIPTLCFRNCMALMELVIPYRVTSIGTQAFTGCSAIQDLKFPPAVTVVPNEAFSGCAAMPHAEFTGGISSLGTKAFYGCNSLKDINLSSSLETIPESAFQNCLTLHRITVTGQLVNPQDTSVMCIGKNSLASCYGLRTVDLSHCTNDIPRLDSTALSNTPSAKTIIVPAGQLTDWQTASVWSNYASNMVEATT